MGQNPDRAPQHLIQIKAPLDGGRLEVFVDGRRLQNVLSVKLETGSGQLTRATLVLFAQADVSVRGEVVEEQKRA